MELEEFFEDIKHRIVKEIKNNLPKLIKEWGDEKPYAVAFVTDSDCVTLWLGVNTYEFLEKSDAEYAEEGDYDYTTKWNPDEWGYSDEDIPNAELDEIFQEISDKKASIIAYIKSSNEGLPNKQLWDLIEVSGFTTLFIEMLVSILQELIEANAFNFNNKEITYFVIMNDDARAIEIENNSAKILNTEKLYNEFIQRETHY